MPGAVAGRAPRPSGVHRAEEPVLGRREQHVGVGGVHLEVRDEPSGGELLPEGASAVVGDQHRAEHGVERVQAVVLDDELVQVGVAEPRHGRPGPSPVPGPDQAQEGRQARPAVRVPGAQQLARPGHREVEEAADGRLPVPGGHRPLHPPRLARPAVDPPEAAVRGEQEGPVGGIDVEGVDPRLLLGQVHQAGGALGGGGRRVRLAAAAGRAGAREQREHARGEPARALGPGPAHRRMAKKTRTPLEQRNRSFVELV
jgi:hypothetical protein